MFKLITNFISILLLVIAINLVDFDTLFAGHAEWHTGPSCGQCHCPKDYECSASLPDGCACIDTVNKTLK